MNNTQEESNGRTVKGLALTSFLMSLVGPVLFIVLIVIAYSGFQLIGLNLQFPFILITTLIDIVVLVLGIKVLKKGTGDNKDKTLATIALILAGIPLALVVILIFLLIGLAHSAPIPWG